jgi:hypothetical protein
MRYRSAPGIRLDNLDAVRSFPVFGPTGRLPGSLSWLCDSRVSRDPKNLHLKTLERPPWVKVESLTARFTTSHSSSSPREVRHA